MNKSQINIIGCVGVPNKYGGFEALAENLAKSKKFISFIYCSGKAYPGQERLSTFHNAQLHYVNLKANGFSSMLYDAVCILHSVQRNQKNLLCLGVSGAWIYPFIRIFFRDVKIITNVDGVEWRRKKFGLLSKIVLKNLHRIAERYSTKIICDNQALLFFVRKKYRKKVEIISYGGDQVLDHWNSDKILEHQDYSLAICRIVPENNVEMILRAFCLTGEKLVFVGNWQHSVYARKIFEKYSDISNISLMNEVYDIAFLSALRKNAKFYIHGHSAGGTNPSLVEALFLCKAILYFDCDFNRNTLKNQGFPFKGVDDLCQLTRQSPKDQSDQYLNVAFANYAWEIICEKYYKCFSLKDK